MDSGRPRHRETDVDGNALTGALASFIFCLERLSAKTQRAEDRALYQLYLAHAAVIIAKAHQDEPILEDVHIMDRLLGQTWLRDENSYSQALAEWDRFKSLFTQSIHGMTVNERLSVLGLLEDFDKAVALRDESHLRRILFKCALNEQEVQATVRSIL